MNLYQLLNSRTELDCPVIIGDVEMPADFCWDENARVTQEGYLAFRSLMDCEVEYDEDKNLLEIPNGNPTEGERFAYALAGYVNDKYYKTWFSAYGENAPCECSHCDRDECAHRESFRRLLKSVGGLELCPMFDETDE